MLTEGTRRMLAEGKRYEAMRVREAPAWVQVIVFALAVAAVGGLFMLTGCATARPVPTTAYQKVQYECQRDASQSHYGGLMELALYHQCMQAHGWSK